MFVYVKFLCDNSCLNRVIIVSPDSDAAVIPLYQSFTNLTFLDLLWFTAGTGDDQRYIPIHVVASKSGLSIGFLLPAMHAVLECYSVSSFSHIKKVTIFRTLKNKIDELTNMIDFGKFLFLPLESPSVVTSIQYVCFLYEEYKPVSSTNKLRYRMFTKKI